VRVDPRADDPASTALVVKSPLVARPDGVWHGADGGIWFANPGAGSIGRLDPDANDPAATVRTFGGEDAAPQDPFDVKEGPDGWLWFTDKAGNALGRIYAGA
jgi:virginiamycin B lyase